MIQGLLLAAFLITLALDELLDVGLLLTVGLSAKNAFLYVLLLAIAVTRASRRGSEGLQVPELHALFLGLIGIASLSIFYRHFVWGYRPAFSLFGDIALLKTSIADMYLMFLVFFYSLTSRRGAVLFMRFFLCLISLMALITLLDVLGMPKLGLVTYWKGRLEGPLGQANEYAVFLSFFIPLLVLTALGTGPRLIRLLCLLGAMVSVALLIQTGSRGGFVSMVGGVLFAGWWLWGGYDPRRAFIIGTLAAMGGAASIALVLVFDPDVRDLVMTRLQLSTTGSVEDVSAGRTGIWAQGLSYQLSRPWSLFTGFGLGSFAERVGIPPHSAYMNYLFSLGIVGLLLWLALALRLLVLVRRVFFAEIATAEERVMLAGLVMGWGALLVAMLTGTLYKVWLFVWPMTGLCLRLAWCLWADGKQPQGQVAVEPAESSRSGRGVSA